MKAIHTYSLLLLSLIILSGGCMVGKKYTRPGMPVDTVSYRDIGFYDTSALVKWFDLYNDTALHNMIRTTIDSNRDLLTAAARIEEARYQAAIVRANLFPHFGYEAQFGGGHAGIDAQRAGGGVQNGILKAYGTLDWEIDLWGKLRHETRSAVAQYFANVENRNALQVSLIAEVATEYFLLRDLDNRLMITEQTLASRREYTRIITDRFNYGYVPELDRFQAVQQEAIAAATIPTLERQIIQIENSIRLLMGMGPGKVPRGYTNFEQTLSPEIPVGLPSQLLERRPDIRAAEETMRAEFELIGVAQANRLPTLSLTGLLGFASPELSTFISGSGFVANGFANIVGPIFNFNQRKNQVKVEEERFRQLYYQYQQTALRAFGDVDNALTYYRTFSSEFEQRKIQADAAFRGLQLSQARYDFGYTSYLEVIVMQNNLFDAQFQESAALQGKLNAIVLLYKALGGGW